MNTSTPDQNKIAKFDELAKYVNRWQNECLDHIYRARDIKETEAHNIAIGRALECCEDIKKEIEKNYR